MDLFTPVIDESKLHPNFKETINDTSKGVQEVLQLWAQGFIDRDGKFVKEFQTSYNSGFWELYLFAVLKHLKIDIDFKFASPDFVSSNKNFVIEAVTANHSYGDLPEWEKSFETLKNAAEEDFFEVSRQSVIRLSNAFSAKTKKYNELYRHLKHVENKPFIIAVSNYSKQDFNLHGDVAMQWLLYDFLNQGSVSKANGTEVPLGIFNDPRYEDVSAVLYSSVATFGKARALSDGVSNCIFDAVRIKDDHEIIHVRGSGDDYKESLCDGLRLFVNPNAKQPIDIMDFADEGIRKFFPSEDGFISSSNHPEGDLCMRIVYIVKHK